MRQFAHAKAQLDHHITTNTTIFQGNTYYFLFAKVIALSCMIDSDPRHLSVIAKIIADLENLIINPNLQDVNFVTEQSDKILKIGQLVRQVAQDKLLISLRERNQASVASCLQVRV